MSRLLERREWLNFKEAARYFGKKLDEVSLTDKDIIRLALEKEITVSINFLSPVLACDYTMFPEPSEKISFFDDDDNDFSIFQDGQKIEQAIEQLEAKSKEKAKKLKHLEKERERWDALESMNTLDVDGIFDLEMRGDVVRHLRQMCGDIVGDSRWFSSEPDVYFRRNNKRFYLLERFGSEKNKVFPDDCQLIVRRKEMDQFIETIKNKESHENSGKQISKTKLSEEKKPHGNTVINSLKREEILKAATYCKAKFPEKCQTVPDWAETIDEKAPLFWKETGEPPLARRSIEDLLRIALKTPSDTE